MVGAGHDDGGERTKDRARERRDDDVGLGRTGVAGVFIRGRGDRRAVGDALEDVVGPAREFGQRQWLDAVGERRATRRRERRVDASAAALAAGVVVARRASAGAQRVVNGIEPRRQLASRAAAIASSVAVAPRERAAPAGGASGRGRIAARDAAADRSLRARRAIPPRGVAVGGKDLSQSRYASALATGRAACSSDITLAGARRRHLQ